MSCDSALKVYTTNCLLYSSQNTKFMINKLMSLYVCLFCKRI